MKKIVNILIMEDDNPFEAKEIRFWSVKTMFKFLLLGVPRLIIVLIAFLVLFFLLYIFENNDAFFSKITQMMAQVYLHITGYKNIDIDERTKKIIKNSNAQVIICNHASYIDILMMVSIFPEAKFIASDFVAKIPIMGYSSASIYFTMVGYHILIYQ